MINTNLLKSKIIAAGYTQVKLAPLAGLSVNTLNAKVNGRQVFNTDEIDRLCMLLDIKSPVEKCDIFLSEKSQQWERCYKRQLMKRR